MTSDLLEPIEPTADQVRELRERAGLTQREFARLLATTVDRIKKYERGLHTMSASLWLLARISCDSLTRARWLKTLIHEEKR